MASTFNAFNFLVGANEKVQDGKKSKNKNKNKNKGSEGTATAPAANGDTGLAAGSASAGGGGADPTLSKASTTQTMVLDVVEACSIAEKAAHLHSSGDQRLKLWKEWIRQASDQKTAKSVRYKDAHGELVEFKQMLLRSKALEITLEGCLTQPLPSQNEPVLAQLLAACLPPHEPRVPQSLASSIVKLAQLLADDQPDTTRAAQKAARQIIASLKSSTAVDSDDTSTDVQSWLTRMNNIDEKLEKKKKELGEAATGVLTRDQTASAFGILQLYEDKFELLQPDHLPRSQPANSASNLTVGYLEDLKAVVVNHLKEAQAFETNTRGKVASLEASRNSGNDAYKREEAILSKQAAEIAQQIRTLEAQLANLRTQATEIERSRTRNQQRQSQLLDGVGNQAAGQAAPQGLLPVQHYTNELNITEALLELVDPVRRAGSSPAQVQDFIAMAAADPLEYVIVATRMLDMNLTTLGDVPNRVAFAKQRISQAEKLKSLSNTDVASKQLDDANKLLSDTVKQAEDIFRTSVNAVERLHSRYSMLTSMAPDQAVGLMTQIMGIDDLKNRITAQFANVMAAVSAPVVDPSNGPRGGPRRGPRPPAGQPAAAAVQPAAPAPTAAAPAVAPADASSAPGAPAPAANGGSKPVASRWAKVDTPAEAASADETLPTPAEALRAAEVVDGFRPVAAKRNRKKA